MADNEERNGNWGDKSGKGRERKDDSTYPQGRDADQMGTHGGSKRNAEGGEKGLPIPERK